MAPMITFSFERNESIKECCQKLFMSNTFPMYQIVKVIFKHVNINKEEFKWLYALNKVLLSKCNGVQWDTRFDHGFNRCNYEIILPFLKVKGIQNITINEMNGLNRFLYKFPFDSQSCSSGNFMTFDGIPRPTALIPEYFICCEANFTLDIENEKRNDDKCNLQIQKHHIFSVKQSDQQSLYLIVFRNDLNSGKIFFIEPGKHFFLFP